MYNMICRLSFHYHVRSVRRLAMSKLSERDSLLVEAKVAEQAERYDDAATAMKKIVENIGKQINQEERNLFSVAYKNIIGHHRSAWRVVSSIEQKCDDSKQAIAQDYREQIEQELQNKCGEVLKLLDDHLLNIKEKYEMEEAEDVVFYLKMKGDYYRYLVEVSRGEARDKLAGDSFKAYEKAYDIATKKLRATHSIRLGLALNFSVFYYEIKSLPDKACEIAKQAFDDAIKDLSNVSADSYKDTTLIMQLLRDNLTLWTSEQGGEQALGED